MGRTTEGLLQHAGVNNLQVGAGARRDENTGDFLRTAFRVLACAACYYLATQLAWAICCADGKASLFFPPHAVLVSVLLLVPPRHWGAYTLAAMGSHFLATQQQAWPA